jgi:hypothetical protein
MPCMIKSWCFIVDTLYLYVWHQKQVIKEGILYCNEGCVKMLHISGTSFVIEIVFPGIQYIY